MGKEGRRTKSSFTCGETHGGREESMICLVVDIFKRCISLYLQSGANRHKICGFTLRKWVCSRHLDRCLWGPARATGKGPLPLSSQPRGTVEQARCCVSLCWSALHNTYLRTSGKDSCLKCDSWPCRGSLHFLAVQN